MIHISSVQFSRSVVSDSLRPHESQHARPPCPSPTPGVTQTHVHWVSDAIQPSHPLLSPPPPAPIPPSIRVFSNELAKICYDSITSYKHLNELLVNPIFTSEFNSLNIHLLMYINIINQNYIFKVPIIKIKNFGLCLWWNVA